MESIKNLIELAGTIDEPLKFDHEILGEKFYLSTLRVDRLSGNADYLPFILSERLSKIKFNKGDRVKIVGQIRSHNKEFDGRMRLILRVFVTEIEPLDESEHKVNDYNSVSIRGFLCKAPNKRETPMGKKISDIMLAVNRSYNKSDYIPVIMWNRAAEYVADMEKGTELIINGRFQSRIYSKLVDGKEIARTAYEVSGSSVEVAIPEGMVGSDE